MLVVPCSPFDRFKFIAELYESWMEFYPDVEEELVPPNQPETHGTEVRITIFVDASIMFMIW
jgi:hypothetical protein